MKNKPTNDKQWLKKVNAILAKAIKSKPSVGYADFERKPNQ